MSTTTTGLTTALQTEINRLYSSITAIDSVYASITAIDTLYASIANINRVYLSVTDIDKVAASIANIDILATNLTTMTNLLQGLSTMQRIDKNFAQITNSMTKLDNIILNLSKINTLYTELTTGGSTLTKASSMLSAYQKVVTSITTSATNSKASEIAAKASETKAATLLKNVENIFDTFDDEYLGVHTADPTKDHDGNPLTTGAVYWNSTDGDLRFYNGVKWEVPSTIASKAAKDALTSENNTKTSETNAKASENASKTSETNSKTSETNAKASETVAKASETNAKTSETNAKTSETNLKNLVSTINFKNLLTTNTAQTISSVKTFTSSPILPNPTGKKEGATKEYVDDEIGKVISTTSSLTNYAKISDVAAKDAKVLTDAKKYTDDEVGKIDLSLYAKITDVTGKDTKVLTDSKKYTDDEVAKVKTPDLTPYAKTTDVSSKDTAVLTSAKKYTDDEIAKLPALPSLTPYAKTSDVSTKDAKVLADAKQYTDDSQPNLSAYIDKGSIQKITNIKDFEKGLTTGTNILSLMGLLETNNGIGLNGDNLGLYGDPSDNSIVVVSQDKEVIRLNKTSEFERLELTADHDDVVYFGSKDGVSIDKIRQPHISYYSSNNTLRFRNFSNLITGNFSNKLKGYTRLSNNISLQWTYVSPITIAANSSTSVASITFPKSFNNNCLAVIPSWVDNTTQHAGKAIICTLQGDPSKSSVSYTCKNLENFAVTGKVVFVAIGA